MTDEVGERKSQYPQVDCDQEAHLKQCIDTAMRMDSAMRAECKYPAHEQPYALARQGIIQGAALEIIRVMRHQPCYVNLPRLDQFPVRGWE